MGHTIKSNSHSRIFSRIKSSLRKQIVHIHSFLRKRPTGKWPAIRPRTRWNGYISDPPWFCLGVESAELSEIAENYEVYRVLLGLLPSRSYPEGKRIYENE